MPYTTLFPTAVGDPIQPWLIEIVDFLAGQQDGDMAVVGRQPHPRDPHVPVLDQFGPRADDGAKVDFADDPRRDRGGSAIAERLAAVEINDPQAVISLIVDPRRGIAQLGEAAVGGAAAVALAYPVALLR